MTRAKLGIAISLYDKFDDLEVLTEILRENFEEEYFIAVSCSHPEGEDIIEERGIDIDEYIQADRIDYSPEMGDLEGKIHLISRIFNSIKRSMEACFEECEYAMHLHSDAWPLDEEKLNEVIDRMEAESKPVAVKGRGPGARTDMFPVGHVNDHFMIFESDYSVENDLFDHNPLDLIPDRGIHTGLMLILLGCVGWSNVLYYSDNSEQVYWDGEDATGVRPMMYNPEWNFVHIATEDFPDDLGKSLQAYYLSEHNLDRGEKIRELIDNHLRDRSEIVEEINRHEKEVNRKLIMRGIRPSNEPRNISWNLETVEENSDLKSIFGNAFESLASLGSGFLNRYVLRSSLTKDVDDPIKAPPENDEIFRIYDEKVDEENFPSDYTDGVWFKDN